MFQGNHFSSPSTKRLHPIMDEPWQYDIISFRYEHNVADPQNAYLDLALQRDDVIRRLRFLSPQGLEIEQGFPTATRGMVILDVTHQGLENINVRVEDFETSCGAIRFWAKAVVDLDSLDPLSESRRNGNSPC